MGKSQCHGMVDMQAVVACSRALKSDPRAKELTYVYIACALESHTLVRALHMEVSAYVFCQQDQLALVSRSCALFELCLSV